LPPWLKLFVAPLVHSLELQYKKQNMINAALSSDDAAMSRLSVADLQCVLCPLARHP
jgi:hypothetical protein